MILLLAAMVFYYPWAIIVAVLTGCLVILAQTRKGGH